MVFNPSPEAAQVNAQRWFLLTTIFLAVGCAFRPQPAPGPEPEAAPAPAAEETVADPAPSAPVNLHEAMARAARRHLADRRTRLTRAAEDSGWGTARYERLPEAAREAGYGDYRGKADGVGTEASDLGRELAELWDVLDLGMARAAGSDALFRDKALRNLLSDVRYAYYRVAAARTLATDAEAALRRADAVIRESGAGGDPAGHHALYERMRRLQRVVRDLQPARAELAVLMGLPPGRAFEIVPLRWERPEIPPVGQDMEGLAELSLRFRPEVRDGLHPDRRAREARAALAEIAPGLRRNDADVRDWWNAGARIAVYLFGAPGDGAANLRTLDLGAVTQTEVARLRYRMVVRAYGDAVGRENTAADSVRAAASPLEAAGRALDVQLARVDRYLVFGELQNALARLYQSVGADPLPLQADAMRVPELALALERSMARWDEMFQSAYAAYGPESRLPRRMETAAETGGDAGSPSAPPLPPLADSRTERAVVAEAETGMARSARAEGRAAAREISVFRDVVTIHAMPAPDAPVIGQGLIGERYPLLGWSRKGWLKIGMNDGSAGWIPTKYVRPVEPKNTAAAAAGAPGPDPMTVVTTTRANVRFDAGLEYQVRYTENEGVRLPVVDTRGEWFQVRTPRGETGWLHRSVVRVEGGGT